MIAYEKFLSEDTDSIVSDRKPDWDIEVFYDGGCPLCRREIEYIRRKDDSFKIKFTDIDSQAFEPSRIGKTQDQLMAEIHGRLPSGTFIVGPEVFRQLYLAIGYRRMVQISRLPLISQVIELAYPIFARFRLRLNRHRCSDQTCSRG